MAGSPWRTGPGSRGSSATRCSSGAGRGGRALCRPRRGGASSGCTHRGCEQKPENVSNVSMERKEVFYLTTHSTYFIYGYMALDIW